MNRPTWTSAFALVKILGTGVCVLNATFPAGGDPPSPGAPAPTPPKTDPKTIWPAGLKELAGRYQFIQVASPGGLWARTGKEARQVSLNELTPAVRDRLRKAELIISDLQFEGAPDAREEVSPSRRGTLRFYSESAVGNLTLHNVPGIGGDDEDKGEFQGRVLFGLNHQSHSNPSVSGVLFQRMQQEPTWGVATLDYADLEAVPFVEGKAPPRRRPAPPNSTTQRPNASRVVLASTVTAPSELGGFRLTAEPTKPGKPAPDKPAPGKPTPAKPMPPVADGDEETTPTIANARVLRSGIEIVAFVEWEEKVNGKATLYNGSIRLIKMNEFRRLQERLGILQERGGPASGSPAPAPGPPSSSK